MHRVGAWSKDRAAGEPAPATWRLLKEATNLRSLAWRRNGTRPLARPHAAPCAARRAPLVILRAMCNGTRQRAVGAVGTNGRAVTTVSCVRTRLQSDEPTPSAHQPLH